MLPVVVLFEMFIVYAYRAGFKGADLPSTEGLPPNRSYFIPR